jgi:hypothetical protein
VRFLGIANDGSRLSVQWPAHMEHFEEPDLELLLAALGRDAESGSGLSAAGRTSLAPLPDS